MTIPDEIIPTLREAWQQFVIGNREFNVAS